MSFVIQQGMIRTWSIIFTGLSFGSWQVVLTLHWRRWCLLHCYVCSRSRGFATSVLQRCMTGNVIYEWRAGLKLELGTHRGRWKTQRQSVSGHLANVDAHKNTLAQTTSTHDSTALIHPFPTMESPIDECVIVVMHWTNMDPGVLMFAIHLIAMPSVHTHPFVRRTEMRG